MNHTIYLGGGCFWGVESYFQRIPGIIDTEVGYSNGNHPNPSYEEVCHGSGHVETVKIPYDSSVISLSKVLKQSSNLLYLVPIVIIKSPLPSRYCLYSHFIQPKSTIKII